jgi:hypothetical protein
MVKPAVIVAKEQDFILSSPLLARPPAETAWPRARAGLAGRLFNHGRAAPTIQLGRTDAFVPAYATALFVIDLMTAILLFAHRAFACAALALSGSREPIIGYGRIFRLKLPASM